MKGMKVDNKNILSRIWKFLILNQWVVLFFVVIIISGVAGSINARFFAQKNLANILEQISVLGLISAGATILIISGNFDISVGSMVGLSASIMAILMINGVNEGLASVIGIIICVLCSTLNGVLSVVFKAPSFIISLATSGIFYGIALSVTQGVIQTIYGKFELIAGTRLFGFFPLIFFISIIGYLFVHFILRYTQIGRRIYAIGSNERAAFLAGINISANKIIFFAISGFLVGISSVLILSRLGGALPSTGVGVELRAIGAVVIGGVPITGGSGNILGTFLGVLLMGVISNSLNMLRINPYFQEMAYGILIIIAIAISSVRHRISGIK